MANDFVKPSYLNKKKKKKENIYFKTEADTYFPNIAFPVGSNIDSPSIFRSEIKQIEPFTFVHHFLHWLCWNTLFRKSAHWVVNKGTDSFPALWQKSQSGVHVCHQGHMHEVQSTSFVSKHWLNVMFLFCVVFFWLGGGVGLGGVVF